MPEPYEILKKAGSPTALEAAQIPIEIGMMGFSLEDVLQGRRGYVIMPLGARDSTKWGGRKWVRTKLTAMEDVRTNRDIIVGNEQGEFKEHTPVELSYEKGEGGYQRVGENYPLPVTVNSVPITYTSAIATLIGSTLLITPEGTKKVRVFFFSYSNADNNQSVCGLRFTTLGSIKHRYSLAANGGASAANIVSCPWDGGEGEALYIVLDAANASGVYVTVGYAEV